MNNKIFSTAIVGVFIAFSSQLMAQNAFEQLPRHQINASFGKASTRAFSHPNLVEINTGGLAYTFNLSQRFWVSAEWQLGFSNFDWHENETFKVTKLTGLTTEKITEIPVIYIKNAGFWGGPQVDVNNVPVALLPTNGFYEFRNWSIMAGYQKSSGRNALRFGLGSSATQLRARFIRFAQGVSTSQYLSEAKNLVWCADAAIQYDYWLTPKIAIGMRLRAIFDVSVDGISHHYTGMLSVGYAIPRFRKAKVEPRA